MQRGKWGSLLLSAALVSHGANFILGDAYAACSHLLAPSSDPLQGRKRLGDVGPTFGYQPSDRFAVPGDDVLLALLYTIEQFGQPGLGIICPDRHSLLRRNLIHHAKLDQSSDWCNVARDVACLPDRHVAPHRTPC